MSARVASKPAWMTEDLADEWIEEGEEEPQSPSEQRMATTSSTRSRLGTGRFGSIEVKELPAGQEDTAPQVGTFIVRQDLPPAQLPQTPGKKHAIKDIFSPLPLEKMFDPPSPPDQSTSQTQPAILNRHNTNRPAKPSKLSQVIAMSMVEEEEEAQGQERPETDKDEIVETDMPNMGGLGKHKPAADCHFTFAVPRQSPPRGDLGLPFSNQKPQAQSTPLLPAQGQLQGQPSTDPRLRLFQFQYDTYTRDHLSALVDSFGVNTPSNGSSDQSAGLALPRSIVADDVDHTREEREESFSRLRSSKRIKLTPPTEPGDTIRRRLSTSDTQSARKKDYVGESKSLMQQIKRARDVSMLSVASNNQANTEVDVEGNETGQDQLDSAANTYLQLPQHTNDRPSTSTSTSMSTNSSAIPSGKGSKYSSLAYRERAAGLMAKIKTDIVATRRIFSEKTVTDRSFASQPDDEDCAERRSGAPSPDTKPQMSQSSPRKRHAEEKENDPELPSCTASVDPSEVSLGATKTPYGKISPEEIAQNHNMNTFAFPVTMPPQQNPFAGVVTDRVRSPNPTFLAPPSAVFSNTRTNSDLNRFVSSSTTATNATGTTLTGGSFVKHPGPPQMVRITPTDLPRLPDRVGKMIYDSDLKRWVKEKVASSQSVDQNQNVDATAGEVEGESDDPFRDFESLRDEDSRNHNATLDASNMTGFSHGYVSTHSEEMQMDDDSDSDTDDDEDDAHFSTFSFTGPAAGVVHVITGEEDIDEEDETTTDTDGEQIPESNDSEISDYDNVDQGDNLSNHIASFASMSIHDSPVKQLSVNFSQVAVFSSVGGSMQTPNAQEKRITQPPRSVLKSASVTPANKPGHRRSVSFSDGRTDGKILDADSADRKATTSSFLPSARTNRITDMLVNMEEGSYDEDESPSKGSQHSGRHPNQSLQPIPNEVETPDDNAVANRSLVRSQTVRNLSSRSSRRVQATPSRANATFLTECSFGVSHDRLVQVITDVQPFEPYWESLTSIDISGKRLDSVARLKEFLPKLDHLKLSNNLLSWLSGIPASVRTLSVGSNALTSLTSFSHLHNIEQLDVSYNDLDSVHQLACLRHLRELRADGNRITSLEGLAHLDGLLKVSLMGNKLSEVDFSGYQWSRLELLNLSCNKLTSVSGLERLTGMVSLDLDNNHLTTLDSTNGSVLSKLRVLRLSGNRINYLDTARFPNIRTLYLDNNSLATNGERGQTFSRRRLLNMHRLGKLENFSARNQSGGSSRDSGLHLTNEDIRDVKRLYLSGNPSPLPMGPTAQACYNLVYLEIAACRLTSLPPNCSALIPNVRVLNLNYNFLNTADIANALTGLTRLRKLTIVGNHMTGTKALIQMLGNMGSNIEMLDFRMNPCTLGWYLPLLVQDKDVPEALLQPSDFAGKAPDLRGSRQHVTSSSRSSGHVGSRSGDHLDGNSNGSKRGGKRGQASLAAAYQEPQVREIGKSSSSEIGACGISGSDEENGNTKALVPSTISGTKSQTETSQSHSNAVQSQSGPTQQAKKSAGPSHWEALDAQFRRGLPDSTYAGRLAYRGFVMRACPNIRVLDGVRVSEKERIKAEALLKRLLGEVEDPDTTIRGVKLN